MIATAIAVDNRVGFTLLLGAEQFIASFAGPAAAALQLVTPPQFRGRVSAFYLFIFTVLGYGCGSAVVAGFTQFLFHDDSKVGWSIALTCLLFMPLGALFLRTGLKPMRDMQDTVKTLLIGTKGLPFQAERGTA